MKTPIYLNALRAFEASARHQSFSAAADELNVTPAAVGQLVKSLEEYLGITLFQRSTGGRARLVTTEAALTALPYIRAGFEKLTLGLEKLQAQTSTGVLNVAISPAFAAKWLLPRIDTFQQAYPEIDIRLDTNLKPVDFGRHGIDIAVRYGQGKWSGLVAEKLMDEEVFPVCSPAFYQKYQQQLEYPQNLLNLPLIHDLTMDAHSGFTTWDTWLQYNKISNELTQRGLKINNSAAVLQAAIEGHGIALARSVMAADDLKTGRLIQLYSDMQCSSVLAYYMVYREEYRNMPKLQVFRSWLFNQALTK
ncbi:Glycine cleavage system transcriptional activator [Acinetobacter calcoaceticus]|nr:Glycine cleavage system transcriptional activator [Acinetobacter calcoaceticus]